MDYKEITYNLYKRGQVTKFEAGVLYKAVKNNEVKVLPETTSMLYDLTKQDLRMADVRYSQDRFFYEGIYQIIQTILDKEFETAQELITEFEQKQIENAGKKSRYFKYLNK